VEPLRILAIAFTFSAISSNSSYIFYALGRPKIGFYSDLGKSILLAPLLIYMASNYGLYGAAMSYLIVNCIMPFISYGLIAYLLNLNYFKILSVQLRPLLSATVMYLVIHSEPSQMFITMQINVLVSMLVAVALGTLVFGVTMLALWRMFGGKGAAENRAFDLTMSLLRKS